MSYSRSLVVWSAVLFVVGVAFAGWGPLVLTWLMDASAVVPNATAESLSDPAMALTWAGFAAVRIFGAFMVGLSALLFFGRKLRSREARRVLVVGLAFVSGLSFAMAGLQAQTVLPPVAWTVVILFGLMFANSLSLLRSDERAS